MCEGVVPTACEALRECVSGLSRGTKTSLFLSLSPRASMESDAALGLLIVCLLSVIAAVALTAVRDAPRPRPKAE